MGARSGGGASGGMGSRSGGGGFNGVESRVSGSINLQWIGKQPAVKAKDLKAGDTTLWNAGSASVLSGVETKGAFTTISFKTGGSRKFKNDRLVGVVTNNNSWQVKETT